MFWRHIFLKRTKHFEWFLWAGATEAQWTHQKYYTVVTCVNAWCHTYKRLMDPLLITPQLLRVIKHICPSLVCRSYESLAELSVSWFIVSGTASLSYSNGLVSVEPQQHGNQTKTQASTLNFCCCDSTCQHPRATDVHMKPWDLKSHRSVESNWICFRLLKTLKDK